MNDNKLKILLDSWRDEMNAKRLTAASPPYPQPPSLKGDRFQKAD